MTDAVEEGGVITVVAAMGRMTVGTRGLIEVSAVAVMARTTGTVGTGVMGVVGGMGGMGATTEMGGDLVSMPDLGGMGVGGEAGSMTLGLWEDEWTIAGAARLLGAVGTGERCISCHLS